MATSKELGPLTGESRQREAGKEELQRRMSDARESISQTVGELRESVEDQYASVKAAVGGVLEWREGFQREPILWSVGALSAGFAFGYTLGVAQKARRRSGGKASALAAFADSLIQELRKAGSQLPLASLDPQVRALFGFDISQLLAEIGGKQRRPRRRMLANKQRASRRKAGARRG